MRCLLTGSNGLLGQHIMALLLSQGVSCLGVGRRKEGLGRSPYACVDLSDGFAVKEVVQRFSPDHVLHAASMTDVDACEVYPKDAKRHNVDAVEHLIDALCVLQKPPYVAHISTDFIFSGKNAPYSESSTEVDPCNIYGQTKAQAEALWRQSGLSCAIIRTSMIYGYVEGGKGNIVLWVREKISQGEAVLMSDRQKRMPIYVRDLAKACVLALHQKIAGVFHVVGTEVLTPYAMAKYISQAFSLDPKKVILAKELPLQKAKRPIDTRMHTQQTQKALAYTPETTFQAALEEIKSQILGAR